MGAFEKTLLVIKSSTVLTIDITSAPSRAGMIPEISKPGTNQAAKPNAAAFTTRAKSPKVTKVIGKEISLRIGLINVLTTPTTKAAISNVVKLFKVTPETRFAVIKRAIAFPTKEITCLTSL